MSRLSFLLLLFIQLDLLAGNERDSLYEAWHNPGLHDTLRAEAAVRFLFSIIDQNQDTLDKYAQQVSQFAEEIDVFKAKYNAYNIRGIVLMRKGETIKVIEHYKKGLKICDQGDDPNCRIKMLVNLGNGWQQVGQNDSAIWAFKEVIRFADSVDSKRYMAMANNNIGIIYFHRGDYSKASHYWRETIRISEIIESDRLASSGYMNLGNIYMAQEDYVKAKEYYLKSLEMREKGGITHHLIQSLTHLGGVCINLNEMEEALGYLIRAEKISLESGNNYNLGDVYIDFGVYYEKLKDHYKAQEYYKKALDHAKETNRPMYMAQGNINIGNSKFRLKHYNDALSHGKLGMNYALELENLTLMNSAAGLIYECYKALGDYESALDYLQLNVKYEDSLKNEENQRTVLRQEYQYAYEKQALADSLKAAEAEKVLDAQIHAQTVQLAHERTQRFALYGGVLALLLVGAYTFKRFKESQAQKAIIEDQKEEVEKAHQEITDSIAYARRIQSAVLPPMKVVKEYLHDSFILYKPKDVVAGDFYWLEPKGNKVFFAAADCTGHGVPGAMVSVICNNGLNRSVREHGLIEPGEILNKTREIVIQEFEKSEEEMKDGMDIALISLDGMKLQYAGAHNPLWIIRNGEVLETKANKHPIGKFVGEVNFETHAINLQKGDAIYVFSDGYVDQFGGKDCRKFMAKRFKQLLLDIQSLTMSDQKARLDQEFESWRGNEEQIDDVCVIGVRV